MTLMVNNAVVHVVLRYFPFTGGNETMPKNENNMADNCFDIYWNGRLLPGEQRVKTYG